MIGGVVFDVNEFLVGETREYGTRADWLGCRVTRSQGCSVGDSTGRGLPTFQAFQPGFELYKVRSNALMRASRVVRGRREDDLYPDARPTLARLRAEGLWAGIAGNQMVRAGGILRGLGLPADMIATSSKRIGHADVAFTMRQYVQTGLEADRQVANTLAQLIIGGSLASTEIIRKAHDDQGTTVDGDSGEVA